MTDRGSPTRRGFLALAGSAALAGCNAFDFGNGSDESPSVDGDALREAVSGELPPTAASLPVQLSASYLDEAERRARERLATVPEPLTADHVPNEAIRNELSRNREHASEVLDAALTDATQYERMGTLRHARHAAAAVAGAWRAIDEERTRDDVVAPLEAIRDDLTSFRKSRTYAGGNPVPAVLVHDAVEELVDTASRMAELDDERQEYRPGSVLALGELAKQVEWARAALADARHVADQQAASVDEPTAYERRYRAAAGALADAVEERYADLPNGTDVDVAELVGRDVGDSPAAELERWLRDAVRAKERIRELRSDGWVAGAILSARRALGQARAFEAVRDRVADGDDLRVESVDQIATRRKNAVQAIESVRSADESPLHMAAARTVARELESVDERLRRRADHDRSTFRTVDDTVAEYVWVAARAAAIAPTADRVVSELRSE